MKTDPLIELNVSVHQPILVASRMYEKWSKIPFLTDFLTYAATGVVVSNSRYFGMANMTMKAIRPGAEEKPTLFIRCAVGNIAELIRLLPSKLPQICFCRRGNDDVMRVYEVERFLRLVKAIQKV